MTSLNFTLHFLVETTSLHTITGKRKRMDDEEETTVKLPKKQRGSRSGETVSKPEPEGTNRGRLRRTKSSKPEEEKDKSLTNSSKDDCVIVLDDLPSVQDAVEKGVCVAGHIKNINVLYISSNNFV